MFKLSLEPLVELVKWIFLLRQLSDLLTFPQQPLSLLLKTCPLITELALYDVVNTPGVAADLSHISSPAVRTP